MTIHSALSPQDTQSHAHLPFAIPSEDSLCLFLPQIGHTQEISTDTLDSIQVDSSILDRDQVDFLNDFAIATEKKALQLMTQMVKSQAPIAQDAYQAMPKFLNWCEQQGHDTSAYREIQSILGALTNLYVRQA